MKNKIIKLALLGSAAMLLASCQSKKEEVTVDTLENARVYIRELYKGNQSKDGPEELQVDLKRIQEVLVNGEKFEVTWTVNSDKVTLSEVDGKIVIQPDFKSTEDYEFTLTANIKSTAGETTTQEFYYSVAKFEVPGWKSYTVYDIADIAENTPYYWGFYQANRDEMLFFKCEMNTKYFATTTNPREASAIYVEKAPDGGYYQYAYDANGAKKYVEPCLTSEGKSSQQFVDTPSVSGHWEASVGHFRWTLSDGNDYYLGTYSSYNTISASNAQYISGESAAKIDISQFPCHFMKTGVASVYGTVATELSETETYRVAFNQVNRGEFLWATGKTNTSYLDTNADSAFAADVKAEKVGDGWRVYFVGKDGVKNYFEPFINDAGKTIVTITTTPTSVATWYQDLNQLRWTLGDGVTYYLGTYYSYSTVSASNVQYIDGDNRAKVFISQFILLFYK